MDLQQLRYLVATVDHGTPHAAARALHVRARTLTRGLRQLEQELGQSLLAASGTPARPTSFGHEVLTVARRILAEAEGIVALAAAATPVAAELAGRPRPAGAPSLAFAGVDGAIVAVADGVAFEAADGGSAVTSPRSMLDRQPVRLARAVRDRTHGLLQADFHAGHRRPRRGREAT